MAKESWRQVLSEQALRSDVDRHFDSLLSTESRTFLEQSLAPHPDYEAKTKAEFRMIILCALKTMEEDPSANPAIDWFPMSLEKLIPMYKELTGREIDVPDFDLIPSHDVRRLGRLAAASIEPAGTYSLAEVITGFEEGYLQINLHPG
jgi:hypothetical protein